MSRIAWVRRNTGVHLIIFFYSKIPMVVPKGDEQWMQRRRKKNTYTLFYTLTKCCIQGRGVSHILRSEDENYSSQAIHVARKKPPSGAFKEVNRFLHRGPHEPRVFAVDSIVFGWGKLWRNNSPSVEHPGAVIKRRENKARHAPRPCRRPETRWGRPVVHHQGSTALKRPGSSDQSKSSMQKR